MINILYVICENIVYYVNRYVPVQLINGYVDIEFVYHWVLIPIVVFFLLPLLILLLFYLSALFLHVYRHRHYIRDAYSRDFWDGARNTLATIWDAHGWIWHGYEVKGLENIPEEGGAILIYYHGAIPIDFYYLLAKCLLHRRRLIQAIGDNFLFRIPGWNLLMDVFHVFPGTIDTCVEKLQQGHIIGIAPGGVLEAQFGDEYYKILWGTRVGFATVALKAKVPIIPIFTQNVREAFRTVSFISKLEWVKNLYVRTRLPIVPIYGGFPVKLRTIIGKPIYPSPEQTPDELAYMTKLAVEDLIATHQKIPGSVLHALLERFQFYNRRR